MHVASFLALWLLSSLASSTHWLFSLLAVLYYFFEHNTEGRDVFYNKQERRGGEGGGRL